MIKKLKTKLENMKVQKERKQRFKEIERLSKDFESRLNTEMIVRNEKGEIIKRFEKEA